MMSKEERFNALKQIKEELLALKDSPLYEYRTANKYWPVIGEGDHFADIMFVGEAPGKTEATTGRPFCGQAGRVLDRLIASAGLKREDVYITNVVKDRPPGNRDPEPEEIKFYAPFLDRQIKIIQPKILATLGRYSMKYLLGKYGVPEYLDPISKLHGKVFEVEESYGPLQIVALYHPAVAVYNPNMFVELEKDFKQAVKLL